MDNAGLASKNAHHEDDIFPAIAYCCQHFKEANGIASRLWVYPRARDGRPLQSVQAMRRNMEFYFREEPELDKPVMTSDCGSDVSAGAERERLWDWNRCACHCLNIGAQAALKEELVHECLEPLTALAARFSKSRSPWNKFKKTQMNILHREEERSDDEGEADFDGDEDLEVGGEGSPA